jgi:Ran GTPase-activating protein (RanGAP) involved in mRNA processing and transport
MSYEELNEKVEYLDLSHRSLGIDGVLDVLLDLSEDKIIKHVNLSYNIALEEFEDPKTMEHFLSKMKKYLARNSTLTALDLAGNFLFYYHPHPSNEHKKNYEKEFAMILNQSKISHIDLSDNFMTGFKGRELDGFLYFMKNYMIKNKAFQVRQTNLNSQGFLSLVHVLGVNSSLTYLDVSDNFGGQDPLGRNSSEGTQVFARALSQTPFLRVLKIARNFLRDADAEHISNALIFMPGFQVLDISGNLFKQFSCRSIQRAICSHSITSYNPNDISKRIGGFRDLDLSSNNIGDGGVREICFALERTKVLQRLHLRFCEITDEGAYHLIRVLQGNSTLQEVLIEGNLMSPEVESAVQAEVETNRLLLSLKSDYMAVNCHALSFETYNALLRKLRYLNDATLLQLHNNASFIVVNLR